MKTLLLAPEFRAELPGWALRGVFCAGGSAFWAVMAGFTSPGEIAGMMVGLAIWVAIFAGCCAWLQQQVGWNQATLVSALKWAAWFKAVLSVLIVIDMLLGACARELVSDLAGVRDPEDLAKLDSFEWTALTTVTDGLFMALLIAILAVVLWCCAAFCKSALHSPPS